MEEVKIIYKNVGELIPYEKNARKNTKAVKYVANSIKSFGFKVPIVIDENNIVICGHTRLKASQKLNLDTVPCIVAKDLTEEQVKTFRLADNKVSEKAEWDFDLLQAEIDDIFNFDMTDFGFEFLTEEEHEKNKNKPLEIQKRFNMHEFDKTRTEGEFEMPTIEPVDYVPERLVGFNYAKSSKEFDFGIHFYLDDYQFERVWNDPEKYIDLLSNFDCVLTPAFSVYYDMALPIKMFNTFRGKLLGQMMQDKGLTVIPTVYWGDVETYDYSFDGLPEGGTLSIYSMNYNLDEETHRIKRNGLIELLKRKKPKNLLIYGNGQKIDDVDFGKTKVFYFKNEVTERMSNIG